MGTTAGAIIVVVVAVVVVVVVHAIATTLLDNINKGENGEEQAEDKNNDSGWDPLD